MNSSTVFAAGPARIGARLFRCALAPIAKRAADPALWEHHIRAYEAEDRASPPQPGRVVFTGSSSIRLWHTLERDMAPLSVVNRGFGGALTHHVEHYFDRLIMPHAPSALVIYAGDNDLGLLSQRRAKHVIRDFRSLLDLAQKRLPNTRIVLLGIKPSRLRKRRWAEMREVNQALQAWTQADKSLVYIDLADALLDAKGEVSRSLMRWDGLHLSARGYERIAAVVRPALVAALHS